MTFNKVTFNKVTFNKVTFNKVTFKKTTLALSVLWAASVAGGAQAASSFSEEASSFLDDSTMTIGLRTHYYEAREDYKNASSVKSVGHFWFRELAKYVI